MNYDKRITSNVASVKNVPVFPAFTLTVTVSPDCNVYIPCVDKLLLVETDVAPVVVLRNVSFVGPVVPINGVILEFKNILTSYETPLVAALC